MIKATLFLLLITFVIASCKKDASSKSNVALTGKWYATKATIRSYTRGSLVRNETATYNRTYYLQLNSDKTGSSYDEDGNHSFTYSNTDSKLQLYFNKQGIRDTSTFQIKSLTSTDLNLYTEDVYGAYRDENELFFSK